MQLRLHSFSEEDETGGLRYRRRSVCRLSVCGDPHGPACRFCELARITGNDVIETDRGMMWMVYSSKTKKTRKIPVRREVAELARRLMASAPGGISSPALSQHAGKSLDNCGWWVSFHRDPRDSRLGQASGKENSTLATQPGTRSRIACYPAFGTMALAVQLRRWPN